MWSYSYTKGVCICGQGEGGKDEDFLFQRSVSIHVAGLEVGKCVFYSYASRKFNEVSPQNVCFHYISSRNGGNSCTAGMEGGVLIH